MRSTIPNVTGERLYQSESENDPIVLGTPEWYDWLDQHTAFTFIDAASTFTARKSMLHTGGSYWKAYHRRQGKLYRIHLGHSYALTLERLQAAARAFAGEQGSGESIGATSTETGASRLHMHTSPRMALTGDHPMALMQTKLYLPRKRSDLISRARLIERLQAGLSGNITLISGPAGFGKTTLIAQWIQSIERPTAWLSLDVHDNEPRAFVQSLTAALQSAFPDAFHGIASLFEAPRFPSVEYVVPLLINDLADLPDDLMLVLDDYHLIRTRDIHSLLDQLIEHLPPQLHLVLISRSDPPLPLARWRAQGYLNDLRPTDLCFTREETEAFLTQELGSVVARETAASLEEQTGGWIAVLRLAALSLRNTADPAAFMEQLPSYNDHSIQQYLVEEVLTYLVPAVQDVLVKASMLEQFCSELCVAILGNDSSLEHIQATLSWLERSNVFILPLDERQGWYRFHHMFQQLLQQRLQEKSSGEELALLHQRASRWYAEQGLIDEAIEHALEAGDASDATQLVEAHFVSAFAQQRLRALERWLGMLPEDQIQGSPGLLFARAWIEQIHGRLTEFPRLLTSAEQLLAASGSSARSSEDPYSRILHALVALGWSFLQYFTGQMQASLESARSALAWLPPDRVDVASLIMQYLAWSYQACGQEEVAHLHLQQAMKEQSAHPIFTARLLFSQELVYLAAGKLHQVEHTARHLLQVAQQADLGVSQQFAHWLLGLVYYEWNHLDAAIYHFSIVIANQHQAHFWTVQDALCGLALAYQAQGSDTQAQETSRVLLALVQEQHNIPQLMTAYAFCGRLALLQNNVEESAQWLELAGEQEIRGPMLFLEDPPVTRAWMFLAQGDEVSVTQGQALLDTLLQHVERMHSTRKTIQVLALQAWAYDLQGRENEALDVLEYALTLARPNGFIRTFANLPPLVNMLQGLRKSCKARKEFDRNFDTYLQDLLAAMSSRATLSISTEALLRQEGLESLTSRELQILHLLEKDLTNKEIARELVVTTGTVKVHTSNVYRKLSVNNRRAAVSLAKTLGFLASGQTARPQLQ
jgi:ATP/maltotriose-dependent transcriptional regulator MalT